MKKVLRSLTVATMAALLIVGTQVTVFAAVDTSSEAMSSKAASESMNAADSARAADHSAAEESVPDIMAVPYEAVGNPETGVGAAPVAALLLAAAAIPVMLKTRKRK